MARVTSARVRQAVLAPEAELAPDIEPEYIALFDEEGNPIALSAASGVPPLGEPGQVLTKNSDDDYDMDWLDLPSGLPAGGAVAEVLTKDSGTDFDAVWLPPPAGITVITKDALASAVIPVGTNVDDIELVVVLTETRLVQFFGRAGHSDPPSSHTFDWALNGVSVAAGGNNSGAVTHYGMYLGTGGSSVGTVPGGAADYGAGITRVLAAGTHTWKHRTTRGSAGGTMQDRKLMAIIFDADIVVQ